MVVGIRFSHACEVRFRGLAVAYVAGEIAHGFQRITILAVALEQGGIHLRGLLLAPGLPQQAAVLKHHLVMPGSNAHRSLEFGLASEETHAQAPTAAARGRESNPWRPSLQMP